MNVLIQISHVAHDGVLVSGGGIQTHFWLEPTWRWCSCEPIEQLSLNKCLRVFMLITAWYESPEIKRNE